MKKLTFHVLVFLFSLLGKLTSSHFRVGSGYFFRRAYGKSRLGSQGEKQQYFLTQ